MKAVYHVILRDNNDHVHAMKPTGVALLASIAALVGTIGAVAARLLRDPCVFNSRGLAYARRGDLDRAIADYNRAIRIDPKSAPFYYNRGNAHSRKGDIDRAIADYTQTIQLDPAYGAAYRDRGFAYETKGDSKHAIADFTQAIQLIGRVITSDPNMPSSLKESASAGVAQIVTWYHESRQAAPFPAKATSPGDWVPPPAAAQWAPGTSENLAIVRSLMPGASGLELEQAQLKVAADMAMLTALIGRDAASAVERSWEHRLRQMYNSPDGDQELNRSGIDPAAVDRLVSAGTSPTALSIIRRLIGKQEELL